MNRCDECRKKLGLTAIQCRCKKYFCNKHRYPEEHECSIDYKEIGKNELKRKVVNCRFNKVDKI